jgi:hypothetical protein
MVNQNDLEQGLKKEEDLKSQPEIGSAEKQGENLGGEKEQVQENIETNEPISDVENQTEQSVGPGIDSEGAGITSSQGVGQPGIDTTKSAIHQEIENILEDDLGDIYAQMDAGVQKQFKEEGEQITSKIIGMINSGKLNFKKVFKLVFGWLSIIPGVNKFFLKQEAKIKTDKILKEK